MIQHPNTNLKRKFIKFVEVFYSSKLPVKCPIPLTNVLRYILNCLDTDSSIPLRETVFMAAQSIITIEPEKNFRPNYFLMLKFLSDKSVSVQRRVIKFIRDLDWMILEHDLLAVTVEELSIQDFSVDDTFQLCWEATRHLVRNLYIKIDNDSQAKKIKMIKSLVKIVFQFKNSISKIFNLKGRNGKF